MFYVNCYCYYIFVFETHDKKQPSDKLFHQMAVLLFFNSYFFYLLSNACAMSSFMSSTAAREASA